MNRDECRRLTAWYDCRKQQPRASGGPYEEESGANEWQEVPGRKYTAPNRLTEQQLRDIEQDFNDFDMSAVGELDTDSEVEDEIEKYLAESDARKVGISETFDKFARNKQPTTRSAKRGAEIPFELHDIYHKWLLELQNADGTKRFKASDIPKGRQSNQRGSAPAPKIKAGLMIPPPYGKRWQQLVEERGSKWDSKYAAAYTAREMEAELQRVQQAIKLVNAIRVIDDDRPTVNLAKKRRVKNDKEGKQPPKSISEALHHPDPTEAYMWLDSINKEVGGLEGVGAFIHDKTRADLQKMGIKGNPIPLSTSYTYKFDAAGEVDRYKTRYALAGHPGNMQQGVHYDKTYASTPNQHATMMLQAIMVKYRWSRRAFDIAQAYLNADLPADQYVAVRYPQGFERKHPETGEDLFMILVKNLYGHPSGGRHWEKERNKVIMGEFNAAGTGYSCTRSIKEPCLFKITKGKEICLMLIHTDDCDMIGTSDEFLAEVHSKLSKHWDCKTTDPGYQLGILRTYSEDKKEVELTMQAFVEQMYSQFKDIKGAVINKNLDTPMTPGVSITRPVKAACGKYIESVEAEAKEYIDLGYQRLLGSLLWAARGVFRECLAGTSMLGRVMSKPTKQAWDEAIRMMNYMYQNRKRGIRFRHDGNPVPIAFVDASNKPDPTDGKCQYGYVHMWMGGPIIALSKKLSHVGLSAAHNEYMAMHWCHRCTTWMRDVLKDMGLADVVAAPTKTYGDNTAAITLSYEDVVTSGNQHIITPYHYNKEVIAMGVGNPLYVPSAQNLADLMTKNTDKDTAKHLQPRFLGYSDDPWWEEADNWAPNQKKQTESQE